MESTENRYAHLLQPIRELTKNWDIDVASELNDYLEELDEMCITFDGGKTRLNFAEAALLIQGSTCIYSKKVELLHTLVYQTLEYINDKNKKRSKEAAEAQNGAAGETQTSYDDDDASFTALDLEVRDSSQRSDNSTSVRIVPLPPESLIPPETQEKNKLPLISVKGEVVCSQKDFRMNLFIPGSKDLILLIPRSTASSSFLLDQHLEPFATQHPAEAPAAFDQDDDGAADAAENFLPVEDMEQEPEEHVERQQTSLTNQVLFQAPSDGRMIRERRNVEKQTEEMIPAAEDAWSLHDPYSVLKADEPLRAGKYYKVPDGLDDGGKRKRKRAAPLQDFRSWFRGAFNQPVVKLKVGPTFLDLNYIYQSTIKDKVRRQRRICRRVWLEDSAASLMTPCFLPPAAEAPAAFDQDDDGAADAAENFLPVEDMEQEPEEHVERQQTSLTNQVLFQAPSDGRMIRERRNVEKQTEEMIPAAEDAWSLHDPYSVLKADEPLRAGKYYKVPDGLDDGGKRKRKRAAPLQDFRSWFRGAFNQPVVKLKVGPTFLDLNYIYQSTIKDKVRRQRRICRRVGLGTSEKELKRTFLQPEEAEPVEDFRCAELLGADNDDSDMEPDGFPDDIPAEFAGAPDFSPAEAQKDNLTYEDLVMLRVEQMVVNSQGYAQETALSRRVKEWEEKIRPELALQEERPPFDIHDYGERIVRELGDVGRRRLFASIVSGLDNMEACKYMLASLQLANDYTVEIDSTVGLEGVDTMALTLLSTQRATDRFHTLSGL
ncbi:PREDICTED: condensin-2 complex subunit H2 [Cyprinodon variegatus]|uniref:condensin-2 complex subunit H2 n=1 Tax=Cyprinodon variegatus TaxID=28743 RepID=UPI0007428D98|nr:PREDICTED: condensin-2 complex subunit H2 [Cyprinodon variegatus]